MRDSANISEPIGITGIGLVSCYGSGQVPNFDSMLESNHWTIQPPSSMHGLSKYIAAVAVDLDIKSSYPKIRAPLPSRYSTLALTAASHAVADSRLNECVSDRIGTVLTSEFGPTKCVNKYLKVLYEEGPKSVNPLDFVRSVSNSTLGLIASLNGFRGMSLNLIGEDGLTAAIEIIRAGHADVVLCVGVDELSPLVARRYQDLGTLRTSFIGDGFGHQSIGVGLGEAAAAIVVERLSSANARGIDKYCQVVGWKTAFDPSREQDVGRLSGETIECCIRGAVETAKDYVSTPMLVASAPGSNLGLKEEDETAKSVLDCLNIPVVAPKFYLGETFGASGIVANIIGATSLKYKNPWVFNRELIGHSEATSNCSDISSVICNYVSLTGNTATTVLAKSEGET